MRARRASPDVPPRILSVWLSSSAVPAGSWWSGRVSGTTNIAVVELRAPSFSYILPRVAFGEFSFRVHVLAVPALYRRPFLATLVARNAAGETDTRLVSLRFR